MISNDKKLKTILVRVDDYTIDKIDAIKDKKHYISKSEAIRQSIHHFYSDLKNKKQ